MRFFASPQARRAEDYREIVPAVNKVLRFLRAKRPILIAFAENDFNIFAKALQ